MRNITLGVILHRTIMSNLTWPRSWADPDKAPADCRGIGERKKPQRFRWGFRLCPLSADDEHFRAFVCRDGLGPNGVERFGIHPHENRYRLETLVDCVLCPSACVLAENLVGRDRLCLDRLTELATGFRFRTSLAVPDSSGCQRGDGERMSDCVRQQACAIVRVERFGTSLCVHLCGCLDHCQDFRFREARGLLLPCSHFCLSVGDHPRTLVMVHDKWRNTMNKTRNYEYFFPCK